VFKLDGSVFVGLSTGALDDGGVRRRQSAARKAGMVSPLPVFPSQNGVKDPK